MQKDHSQSKDQAQNKLHRIPLEVNRISLYFENVQKGLFSFSDDNICN